MTNEKVMNKLIELNDSIAMYLYRHEYRELSFNAQKVVNGFVRNYLLIIELEDNAISIDGNDPSIWDEVGGVE